MKESEAIARFKSCQENVGKCEKCGLFYKPSLGHKCKVKE